MGLLRVAVSVGDASARHLAYLTDRVLVADGQPQLYGTQYTHEADGMELRPQPIADPERLDERRAAMGWNHTPSTTGACAKGDPVYVGFTAPRGLFTRAEPARSVAVAARGLRPRHGRAPPAGVAALAGVPDQDRYQRVRARAVKPRLQPPFGDALLLYRTPR